MKRYAYKPLEDGLYLEKPVEDAGNAWPRLHKKRPDPWDRAFRRTIVRFLQGDIGSAVDTEASAIKRSAREPYLFLTCGHGSSRAPVAPL